MKNGTLVLTTFFICAALTFSAASVRADAISTSQAWIDWTSLVISGAITWTEKGSESYAWAEDETGWDEDDGFLYEEVSALADGNIMGAYSDADAYRWGYFVATSDGLVEISVDYELVQKLSTENGGEWADGIAAAELWLMNEWDMYPTCDSVELYNEVFDGDSMSDSASGTLTVSVWFDTGDEGWFDVGVWNEAYVEIPEPATIALLGLGTLSMVSVKRRRGNN